MIRNRRRFDGRVLGDLDLRDGWRAIGPAPEFQARRLFWLLGHFGTPSRTALFVAAVYELGNPQARTLDRLATSAVRLSEKIFSTGIEIENRDRLLLGTNADRSPGLSVFRQSSSLVFRKRPSVDHLILKGHAGLQSVLHMQLSRVAKSVPGEPTINWESSVDIAADRRSNIFGNLYKFLRLAILIWPVQADPKAAFRKGFLPQEDCVQRVHAPLNRVKGIRLGTLHKVYHRLCHQRAQSDHYASSRPSAWRQSSGGQAETLKHRVRMRTSQNPSYERLPSRKSRGHVGPVPRCNFF
jgi:hypothetical protein